VESDKGKWLNNERLEFLGDAILDAVIADILYMHFPNRREGYLTNTRSKIVQRENLNRIAVKLGLHKMVIYSTRLNSHNIHLYGNALEALIGAIYLDQGYRKCYHFVDTMIIKKHINLDLIARKEVNFKSALIEWSQKNKLSIVFDLIESFTDNNGSPVFQTGITLFDRQIGVGIGYSKKESQQNAAKMAIKKLRTDKEILQHISHRKEQQHNGTDIGGFEELPEDVVVGTEPVKNGKRDDTSLCNYRR
jgi:ribonuclease-3